jgi:hypothetical protein
VIARARIWIAWFRLKMAERRLHRLGRAMNREWQKRQI